ncbi:MAG: ROK family protein [Acidimicrobiales bacterium]
MVDELIEHHDVGSIGLGIPGLVTLDGRLRYGPNVDGVLDLDLVSLLRQRTGLPTRATNDGSCAALAESRLGAGRGVANLLFIAQGTGIAGGLIVDGVLALGANGFAGEPGHMLVQDSGPLCACGRIGCWEAVASGTALANLAHELGPASTVASWIPAAERDRPLIGEDVAAAFERGDPVAAAVFDRFAYWTARGIGSLINLLDPELVVLGGGVARSGAHFVAAVARQVDAFVLGAAHRPSVPVVGAHFVERAGVVGAALFGAERS